MRYSWKLLLALVLLAAAPAVAHAQVNFGDDTSRWANDGECDDPRFEGPGMADVLLEEDRTHDATDCRALFEQGRIQLRPTEVEIDFGDNGSLWADNGECDDPRFEGPGMANKLLEEDRGHDATDCRTLFDIGQIQPRAFEIPDEVVTEEPSEATIDFGDDVGTWPHDGECDDPRFAGAGGAMGAGLTDNNRGHDATDCRTLFELGRIRLRPGGVGIDFGDDASPRANDGECDDPRFEGSGVADGSSKESRAHDASDCRALFEQGRIHLRGGAVDIDFGDNASLWANDGECDDPSFEGPGMATILREEDRAHDAADCRALFEQGRIHLRGGAVEIDFGDNASLWANDGECDDPRFEGPGMATILREEDRAHDAADCRALFEQGRIHLRGGAVGIDFGDNASLWANDGECDDPRFEGPGMATILREEDRAHDAADCRALFEQGRIHLRGGAVGIDFGDNASLWANDGECDDPRFEGPGMATILREENRAHDAADCRALFEQGRIHLRGGAVGIDFGDNASLWANDGECDDPSFEGPGMATILREENRAHDAADCRALFEQGRIHLRGGAVGIDFGDDASSWANNGECDDPRFEGPGMATILLDEDRGHDATDCRSLFEQGSIQLAGAPSTSSASLLGQPRRRDNQSLAFYRPNVRRTRNSAAHDGEV